VGYGPAGQDRCLPDAARGGGLLACRGGARWGTALGLWRWLRLSLVFVLAAWVLFKGTMAFAEGQDSARLP
jgi:hypothetical protein